MTTEQGKFTYTGGDDAARFATAEQHRAGVQFKGAPRDTMVRIVRYKNGAVHEIIEKHVKVDERGIKRRKGRGRKPIQNWPSKTARTRAKLAKAKRMKRDAERVLDIGDEFGEDA